MITRSILLSFSQAQWQGNQNIFIFRLTSAVKMMKGAPKAEIFPGNTMVEQNTKFENIMIENKMETGHQSILRAQ